MSRRRGAARPPARLDPALAQIINSYAQPLPPHDREAFRDMVGRMLPPPKLRGPGSVMRVCAEVQRAFLTATTQTVPMPRPEQPAPAPQAAPMALPILGLASMKFW